MDEPWDEDRWEEAFQENDRRTDKLLLLQEAFRAARPAPPDDAPEADRVAWERALERFLARQMGWDDLADDLDRAPAALPWAEALSDDPDDPADPDDDFGDRSDDPLYQTTERLTGPVIAWHKALPPAGLDDPDVQTFWIHALTVGAKVAGARVYTAPASLGGRVAALKRALAAAQTALDALGRLRDGPHLTTHEYQRLVARAHEVREAVALAVQDARERFRTE